MKIAIKGHESRGKEVIQILESLGGVNICPLKGETVLSYYYIDYDCNNAIHCHDHNYVNKYCKKYTLEEFEKVFHFKVGDEVMFPVTKGWLSGKIIGLDYAENQLKYKIHDNIGGYSYVEPYKLQLYPMKEERNITLTLDKAKEWYNKGGELKEIALQAFSEKELNPLPRSWEEYCRRYGFVCLSTRYTNISLKYDALLKLEQLRDCWRQGWEPNWNNGTQTKYCICCHRGEFKISILCETRYFLSFPTMKIAEEFLECFKDLIKQASDLI